MRKFRRILQMFVPAIGMALVIGAVLFGQSLAIQLFLVVAGLLLTEAGLWRLADPFLPDERKYLALRSETDHFTALVRQLNAAALAVDEGSHRASPLALEEVKAEMHRSVDRMVNVAGKTDAEGAPARPAETGKATPAQVGA